MSDDVYLYRGDINRLGEVVPRDQLPAGAARIDVQHHEGQGDDLRTLEVYLLEG